MKISESQIYNEKFKISFHIREALGWSGWHSYGIYECDFCHHEMLPKIQIFWVKFLDNEDEVTLKRQQLPVDTKLRQITRGDFYVIYATKQQQTTNDYCYKQIAVIYATLIWTKTTLHVHTYKVRPNCKFRSSQIRCVFMTSHVSIQWVYLYIVHPVVLILTVIIVI
jgi:hypothetical protein